MIKDGVRVNAEGGVKEFDQENDPFFCFDNPPCVATFEWNIGAHSFSMRAHVPEKGWSSWGPTSEFKIDFKEGAMTHIPHREL